MSGGLGFTALYAELPRQGPGDGALVDALLARLAPPPAFSAVDVGCGTGAEAIRLAETHGARLVAIDSEPAFIAALSARLAARPLRRGTVAPVCGDMTARPWPDPRPDVILCEGAAYLIGFERALGAFRAAASPGARLIVSECVWWGAARPAMAAALFADHPAMTTPDATVERAERAGWTVLETAPLPPASWIESYYGPMAARLDAGGVEPTLAAELRREIAVFDDHSDAYGYLYLALRAA